MAAEHHVFGRDVTVDKAAAVQGLQAPQQQAPQDAGEWPALVPGCRPDSRHEVLQRALEDVHDEVGPVVVAPRIQQEGDPQTPLGPLLRDRLEHARLRLLGGPLQGYLYMIVEVLSLVHTGTSEARTYGAEHVVLPDPRPRRLFLLRGQLDLRRVRDGPGRSHLLPQGHREHAQNGSGPRDAHRRRRRGHRCVLFQHAELVTVACQLLGVKDLLPQKTVGDELFPGAYG
mmetsp:Transcript_54091/g.167948  ORF Transcript_54091/g.167948 Transcript_54091/m.167948 type:complete len:229 (-) Transcript_54091:38-724(-)